MDRFGGRMQPGRQVIFKVRSQPEPDLYPARSTSRYWSDGANWLCSASNTNRLIMREIRAMVTEGHVT